MAAEDEFSVYVGNLDCRIPLADLEELMYELFLQVSENTWYKGSKVSQFTCPGRRSGEGILSC